MITKTIRGGNIHVETVVRYTVMHGTYVASDVLEALTPEVFKDLLNELDFENGYLVEPVDDPYTCYDPSYELVQVDVPNQGPTWYVLISGNSGGGGRPNIRRLYPLECVKVDVNRQISFNSRG